MGKIGKNSFDIQESNRVSVLRILSKEDVLTRADLSRMTGLKQATITNIINDLLSSGVVSETGTLKGNLGRRSIGIRLNAENFNVVGIKIARRSYSVGIFNIKKPASGQDLSEAGTVHRRLRRAAEPWSPTPGA